MLQGSITIIYITSLDLDKINLEQFGHTVIYFAHFLIYKQDHNFKRAYFPFRREYDPQDSLGENMIPECKHNWLPTSGPRVWGSPTLHEGIPKQVYISPYQNICCFSFWNYTTFLIDKSTSHLYRGQGRLHPLFTSNALMYDAVQVQNRSFIIHIIDKRSY